jgi:hypothetical protein
VIAADSFSIERECTLRVRKGGRVVECAGLEIRCTVIPYRGFESHPFRQGFNEYGPFGPFFVFAHHSTRHYPRVFCKGLGGHRRRRNAVARSASTRASWSPANQNGRIAIDQRATYFQPRERERPSRQHQPNLTITAFEFGERGPQMFGISARSSCASVDGLMSRHLCRSPIALFDGSFRF